MFQLLHRTLSRFIAAASTIEPVHFALGLQAFSACTSQLHIPPIPRYLEHAQFFFAKLSCRLPQISDMIVACMLTCTP